MDKRRLSVVLAATISLYSLAFMYIFRTLEYGRFKMSSSYEDIDSSGLQSSGFTVANSSGQTSSVVFSRETAEISTVQNSFQAKASETLSIKLSVRHVSRGNMQYSKNTKEVSDVSSYFRARLQGTSVQLIKETMKIFDLVMTENSLEYMMYAGTLIGSYRHHGLVPWDDDTDVLVPLSSRRSVYTVLTHIGSQYVLNNDWMFTWKLFSSSSDPIRGYNWSWPYLDIFFYAENETHIWDIAPQYQRNFVYPKNIIFPLRRRPFMDLMLLAPRNPRAVLDTNYDVDLCKSGSWIHKWERNLRERVVPCSVLQSKLPFVWRRFENGGCNETLSQNGESVSSFFDRDNPC